MPLYMDIHEVNGVTAEAVAEAHFADVAVQSKHGVEYVKYWVNESQGKIFCLCNAPNAEAADNVHREAHGLAAERIIEVDPELAEGFMGGGIVAPTGAVLLPTTQQCDPGIRTILFTDIVDSTVMTQRLGDKAAMAILDRHDGVVRKALASAGGREVKHLGDGIMAVFTSAQQAVLCASQIQDEIARQVMPEAGDHAVRLRIGSACGEPVERHGDFFGSTVQLAARLCGRAAPNQTLVSSAVTELCADKRFRFEDIGEVTLKGFDAPVRAFAAITDPASSPERGVR